MKTTSRTTERGQRKAGKTGKDAGSGRSPSVTCGSFQETLEEHFVEVAFAEAADYDDIHRAIQREHQEHCNAA